MNNIGRFLWTKDNIINYVNKTDFEFIELIKLNGFKSIITVKCKKGHYSTKKFSSFKINQGCTQCYNDLKSELHRKPYGFIKDIVESVGYKLVSTEYVNNRTPLDMICSNGHKIKMTYDSIRSGYRCRECSGSKKHNIYEVKSEVRKEGYEILSDNYIDNKHYLTIMCPNFHIFKIRYDHWVVGIRCPKCKESKGEKFIENFLNNNKIYFKKHHPFNDCRNINPLPFDFYLPKYNILIEYDGEQHYYPIDYFGGFEGFMKIKHNDGLKNEYCLKNNIPLLRIPYWDFDNIEEILIKQLNLDTKLK